MDNNQKVGLGCGTLILIALIVLIFGNAGSDELRRDIKVLRQEVSSLEHSVRTLQTSTPAAMIVISPFIHAAMRHILYIQLTDKSETRARRLNPTVHVRKIVALCEIYGEEAVGRAIEDALEYQAFSSEYIANILEQRARRLPEPGALHLTRREDLLDLELPEPDLSIYDQDDTQEDEDNEQEEDNG